jgi:hypothetical protein
MNYLGANLVDANELIVLSLLKVEDKNSVFYEPFKGIVMGT